MRDRLTHAPSWRCEDASKKGGIFFLSLFFEVKGKKVEKTKTVDVDKNE